QIHAGGGGERAQAVDVDLDAALDHAGDQAGDQRTVFGCLLDLGLRFFFAQRFAREHDQPATHAVVVHAGDEAIPHRRNQIIRFHLVAVEDGQRLAGEVDHDRRLEHGGHFAEHLFAGVEGRAITGTMMGLASGAAFTRFSVRRTRARSLLLTAALLLRFVGRRGAGGTASVRALTAFTFTLAVASLTLAFGVVTRGVAARARGDLRGRALARGARGCGGCVRGDGHLRAVA